MDTKKSLPKASHFVPYTPEIEKEILSAIGVSSFDDLLNKIPEKLKRDINIPLDKSKSELEVTRLLRELSGRNQSGENVLSFVGGGAYDHFIPSVIQAIVSRSEFSTSYTPYQAEVSQGTLQAIYEFQSMICDITHMEVTNASLYDGASAAAEACLFAERINGKKVVLLSDGLFDSYQQVIKTYLQNSSLTIEIVPNLNGYLDLEWLERRLNDDVLAVLIQSPNRLGLIESGGRVGELISEFPALFIVVGDPISYGIFATPGEWGADVYVGEGQVLGSPLSMGGPYLGLFATKLKYVRKMPGRLVAAAKDIDGKPGFVLALQTREQHIRRERATSNICTNQGLMALTAVIYLSLLGKKGFRKVASLCFQKAHYLAGKIRQISGFSLPYGMRFFKEFVVKCPVTARVIIDKGMDQGILAGTGMKDHRHYLRIAVTEKKTKRDLNRFVNFLEGFKE